VTAPGSVAATEVVGVPAVGEQAPDFTLVNQFGEPVRLADFRGRNVVLVFYPFAFSGICTGELCEIRDNLAVFEHSDAEVLAVSVDSKFALRAYAGQEGYGFNLLADFWPHGSVAQAYGVFNDRAGFALRGTFLVDKAGAVQFAEVNGPGEARDQDGWRKAVAALVG